MKENKVLDVNNTIIKEFIDDIYNCFLGDAYEFEYFCKLFLIKEGFDEVEVTRRSKDGGIDLKAIKKGYDDNGADTISYKIQAKRFKPNRTVSIKSIRELKGVLEGHEKGIFITTGKYTKATYEFINECNPKCIILIDGFNLIKRCINLDIGFLYRPVFCKDNLMKSLYKYKDTQLEKEVAVDNISDGIIGIGNILKVISDNDIKTRILPIPTVIFNKIPQNIESSKVVFNCQDTLKLKINRNRKYFGGVTEIYRRYNLLDEDNNRISKESYWNIDENNETINVTFKD